MNLPCLLQKIQLTTPSPDLGTLELLTELLLENGVKDATPESFVQYFVDRGLVRPYVAARLFPLLRSLDGVL